MSSTEEDGVLLRRSQEVALKESEAEVESVVESVIRGEERVRGCDDRDGSDEASVTGSRDETGEAVAGTVTETAGRGFGEKMLPRMRLLRLMVRAVLRVGPTTLLQATIVMTWITWRTRKVSFPRN